MLTNSTPEIETPKTGKGVAITFPRGLLGFEDYHEFRLERDSSWEPLAKLQSVQDPRLSFVIAPPRVFLADFCVRIDPMEVAELELDVINDAELWSIVTIPEDPRRMSANLQGPLVINRVRGLGKQVVLTRSEYSTQHPILAQPTTRD